MLHSTRLAAGQREGGRDVTFREGEGEIPKMYSLCTCFKTLSIHLFSEYFERPTKKTKEKVYLPNRAGIRTHPPARLRVLPAQGSRPMGFVEP